MKKRKKTILKCAGVGNKICDSCKRYSKDAEKSLVKALGYDEREDKYSCVLYL